MPVSRATCPVPNIVLGGGHERPIYDPGVPGLGVSCSTCRTMPHSRVEQWLLTLLTPITGRRFLLGSELVWMDERMEVPLVEPAE